MQLSELEYEAAVNREDDHLLIVGSYPPPQGGCSVHVQRLANLMSDKFSVEVLDLYGEGECFSGNAKVHRLNGNILSRSARVLLKIHSQQSGVVHFHVSAMSRFVFLGFIFLAFIRPRVGVVLTIHSGSLVGNYRSSSQLWKVAFSGLVKRFDRIITVNSQQKELLQECGVKVSQINTIPAYLPPLPIQTDKITKILEDVNLSGRKLIILSGYGVPLYGYEKVLTILEKDASLASHFDVVICTYNTFDKSYMAEIESRALMLDSVKVVRNLTPEEFTFLLSKADIYVRATDRDGDAVAVREAGYFKVPIIASDCVDRPAGVVLFRRDDPRSLVYAFNRVLESSSVGQIEAADEGGYGTLLEKVYRGLCDEKSP